MQEPPKDTAWGIFEPLFMVRVPQEALRSEQEVRTLGTPSTGNKHIDKALSRQRTTTYMNIARMAELANEGWAVSVVSHDDCKKIYDYVQAHLEAWVNILTAPINRPNAPYEDLYVLDRFAQTVFAHARHLYNAADAAENGFMRQMEDLGLLGEFSIFQPAIDNRKKLEALENNEKYEPASRESLGDFFTAGLAKSTKLL